MGDPIDTVACDVVVACELSETVEPNCPIIDETDRYRVTVRWLTDGRTFEKHSLRDAITGYEGQELTHESLCADLAERCDCDGIDLRNVRVRDLKHANMAVER